MSLPTHMALSDVRKVPALDNTEGTHPTRPADIDINNSEAENETSVLSQISQSASSVLLNNLQSPRSQSRPTYSNLNSNNHSSGNQNSVVVGGTSIDASNLVLAAGRDLIMNISMDQAKKLLESSTLKESLCKDSNSDVSSLGTASLQEQDLSPSTPNPTSDQQIGSPTSPSMHKPTSSNIENPISPPLNNYTSRHFAKSLAPGAKSQMKRITPENLKKKHLPGTTHECIVNYMCASGLFYSTIAIPLWRPSPSLHDSKANHTRNWTRNIYLGDVGVFDDDGGFDTYFNIFENKEDNNKRGHKVPSNFIPYHKKLSNMSIKSHSDPPDTLRVIGFTEEKTSDGSKSVTLSFPINSTRNSFSALHLRDGFRSLRIHTSEEGELKEYLTGQQADWYDSLAKNLEGRYLAIIMTSYRAKAWASVTATRSKAVGKVRLCQREIEKQKIYSWAPEDNKVFIRNGPSGEHIQKIGAYLQTLTGGSEVMRKELEECHVVAVEAYYLPHEKSSRGQGRTFRTRSELTVTKRAAASIRNFFSR